MSQSLQISNFDQINIKEKTTLNADTIIGATSVALAYSNNILANDYMYVGRRGSESGEVSTVTSVTDAITVVIAALTKPHNRFDDVTTLFGNKIQVYRAVNVDGTAPLDAAFATLGSPIDIDFDQVQTYFTDAAGGSGYWYKYTYRNSFTATETALADCPAVRGGVVGQYCSIESIRKEAGFQNNRNITDADIDQKRQAAQGHINSELGGIYVVPFTSPIHPFVAELTRIYAAGMLLTKDYGTVKAFSTNEGKAKMDWVDGQLKLLKDKTAVLRDVLGNDTSVPNAGGFTMYPDASTDGAAVADGGPKFTSADRH